MNRETWLNEVANLMAPAFADLGHPLPKFRASIGFPSGGKDTPATAECWDKRASGDGHFEIFLNPGRADSKAVACTLAHELTHAAVGLEHGHKGDFAKVVFALGFKAPLTHAQTDLSDKLGGWLDGILAQVGDLPHAALSIRTDDGVKLVKKSGGGMGMADDGGEGPISSRPKKQSTRMLKAKCQECGYTIRLSSKWARELGAQCPKHGGMEIEGLEDETAGDDAED